MPDYDFYHGLYTGQQVDSAVARALVGGQLDQDIAAIRAAVGSPLVANTAAEMTNINKIYVYTGSEAGYATGHWYYYEGGSWQDGGLYNSAAADDEMSDSSTNAVQNKVIKEYVDDVRTDLGSDIADVRTDLGADILAEQTRAENVEALKAPLASPALTGTPTAPTAAAGTANTQIATTAYADNAVAVEKARAEAVEATKADQSFAEYILLREEEDRQILFGSIVEAAEDEYSELRSAPIHNAITIGGSVYPRMDRTRMAIDAIKGRTVAFNQLVDDTKASTGVTFNSTTGIYSVAVTPTTNSFGLLGAGAYKFISGHKYYIRYERISAGSEIIYARPFVDGVGYILDSWSASTEVIYTATATAQAALFGYVTTANVEYTMTFRYQVCDITAQYNGAIDNYSKADAIAYVRQRMDLDYYESNSGELKAPVVSGVDFVGFNVWDEEWENGAIVNGVPVANPPTIRSKNFCPCIPSTTYYVRIGATASLIVWWYDENQNFTGQYNSVSNNTITAPSNAHYFKLGFSSAYGATYKGDTCINLSNPSRNGEYEPYQHTTLSIPSTRLDGVGTAQDVMYVREDGENDYSLIKTAKMELVDLGTLNWTTQSLSGNRTAFKTPTNGLPAYPRLSTSATPNAITPVAEATYQNAPAWGTNVFLFVETSGIITGGNLVFIFDDGTYADAAAFKSAMDGKYLAYEKIIVAETVIAEHLTLAEVSAIAENGGIISVISETGHIVQPDMVCDVVISRSAS